MKSSIKNKLRWLRDTYCYLNFFLNRGLAILNTPYAIIKYTAFAGIAVNLINQGFHTDISIKGTIIFTPFLVILGVIIGVIDTKKIHLLQKDNEIGTRYNTYLVRLIDKNK